MARLTHGSMRRRGDREAQVCAGDVVPAGGDRPADDRLLDGARLGPHHGLCRRRLDELVHGFADADDLGKKRGEQFGTDMTKRGKFERRAAAATSVKVNF